MTSLFQKWTLGRLFGVELKLHGTFILLLAFFLIKALISRNEQDWGYLLVVVVLFSVVVAHEFGHILTARKFGVQAKEVLLTPIGGIAFLQVDSFQAKAEFWTALGGPAVNVVLGGISYATLGWHWFTWMNVALLVFNLIPAFPMDGGRALRALLAMRYGFHKATLWSEKDFLGLHSKFSRR